MAPRIYYFSFNILIKKLLEFELGPNSLQKVLQKGEKTVQRFIRSNYYLNTSHVGFSPHYSRPGTDIWSVKFVGLDICTEAQFRQVLNTFLTPRNGHLKCEVCRI